MMYPSEGMGFKNIREFEWPLKCMSRDNQLQQ